MSSKGEKKLVTESVRAINTTIQLSDTLSIDVYMMPDGEIRAEIGSALVLLGHAKQWFSRLRSEGSHKLKALQDLGFTGDIVVIPKKPGTREASQAQTINLTDLNALINVEALAGNKRAIVLQETFALKGLDSRFRDVFEVQQQTPDEKRGFFGLTYRESLEVLAENRTELEELRHRRIMIQTQTIPKTVTFDEFVAWYPENSVRRYELHNGVIVEMPLGTGPHSRVTGFTRDEISAEIRRLKLPYFIPGDCLLKPIRDEAGYQPDVIVLDQVALANEPRWDRESIITMGSSVRLAVEVVSTNWQDDYHFKFADYERLGIPEYWVVDYAALGGRRFVGNPKQPTLSVCQLVDGEYHVTQFREDDLIESPAFPELKLTAEQIFRAGLPPTEPS
jgi:Uma2 family endonuclease